MTDELVADEAESVSGGVECKLTWDGGGLTVVAGTDGYPVANPIMFEHWDGQVATQHPAGYDEVVDDVARVSFRLPDGGSVDVTDEWRVAGPVVVLRRRAVVVDAADGAFLTEVQLSLGPAAGTRTFVPGMLYGTSQVNAKAIGSPALAGTGIKTAYIREDRMCAPLVMTRSATGPSVAMMDARPNGATTAADADDISITTIVDAGLRFGALGTLDVDGTSVLAFRFPGSEGEMTYRGGMFPGGQVHEWRRRYHPLQSGLVQKYEVHWRFGEVDTFAAQVTGAWRWAWEVLAPVVTPHDIAVARVSLFDQLMSTVVAGPGGTGIPHFLESTTGRPVTPAHPGVTHALMGFTGRNTDCAFYLIREADRVDPPRSGQFKNAGVAMLDSMVRVPSSPPSGEGFDLNTGVVVPSAPHEARIDVTRLRGLSEGAKSVLRAWRYERDRGDDHGAWLTWGVALTDWLLSHQRDDGSFPREWLIGSDEIADSSGYSTYNVVPLLVEAHHATGDRRYLDAAVRAGDYLWASGHQELVFVGGTVDNPDIVDKEAGTISLEAYLALYEATADRRWLEYATVAGDFSETWIYIWNVPVGPTTTDRPRGWKAGVTTVGAQLIASGHSLVDQYMAFDVGNFAKMFAYTGDRHYFDVARLLLHNTKTMLALPGRSYDLAAPGWQQEHWSFAPVRGDGIHRGWLPWVTCSHIEGIVQTEIHDPEVLRELASGPATTSLPGRSGPDGE